MLDKLQALKLIFVTDIHLQISSLQKLEEWSNQYHNNESKFDYCFIGGDTGNCDYEKETHDEEKMWVETTQVHKKIKEMFACKTFFVPGNHDCKRFFKGVQTEAITNIHNKKVELSEGLELLGFGGAVPGYINNNLHWAGFPYKSEKDLENEWEKGQISLNPHSQLLILSHIGPHQSETAIDRENYPESITTGSHFLEKLLVNKNIIGWFHGHTHAGSNSSKINNVEIFNPGSLKAGSFMYVELIKMEGRWKVSKKVFENL